MPASAASLPPFAGESPLLALSDSAVSAQWTWMVSMIAVSRRQISCLRETPSAPCSIGAKGIAVPYFSRPGAARLLGVKARRVDSSAMSRQHGA